MTYNSTTYVDGGSGGITIDYVNSSTSLVGIFPISQSVNTISIIPKSPHVRNSSNAVNQPLIFYTPISNPTTGNSPIDVYITYRIVTL